MERNSSFFYPCSSSVITSPAHIIQVAPPGSHRSFWGKRGESPKRSTQIIKTSISSFVYIGIYWIKGKQKQKRPGGDRGDACLQFSIV